MSDTFHLEILTPQRTVFDGEVERLAFQTTRGVVEVLPGHAEMVTVVDIGVAHLHFPGDFGFGIAVHGGLLKIHPAPRAKDEDDQALDRVMILASIGEHPESIDITRAEAALERAEQELPDAEAGGEDAGRILRDRLRAEARIGAFKSFRKNKEEQGAAD